MRAILGSMILWSVLSQQATASHDGVSFDQRFLSEFVCDAYLPRNKFYKANPDFSVKQLFVEEYKYLNLALKSIEANVDSVSEKQKSKLRDIKFLLEDNRAFLDKLLKTKFDMTFDQISAVHNMITDDVKGLLTDYFEIYILGNSGMASIAGAMDTNERKIKRLFLEIVEDVDPDHELVCE